MLDGAYDALSVRSLVPIMYHETCVWFVADYHVYLLREPGGGKYPRNMSKGFARSMANHVEAILMGVQI